MCTVHIVGGRVPEVLDRTTTELQLLQNSNRTTIELQLLQTTTTLKVIEFELRTTRVEVIQIGKVIKRTNRKSTTRLPVPNYRNYRKAASVDSTVGAHLHVAGPTPHHGKRCFYRPGKSYAPWDKRCKRGGRIRTV